MNLSPSLACFYDFAQHRTHNEAAATAPGKAMTVGWGGVVHRAAAGEPPLPACVFSVPLPTGTAFCPTHKDAETLTERGPGRSLPDVIQLPIQCPHGVPFPVHYLAATAAVEFSFCFDTLGLHHLIAGKPL